MTTMIRASILLAAAGVLLAGCQDLSDSTLVFPTGGNVEVLAWQDQNGDRVRGGGDSPLAGLPVTVRHWNARAAVDGGVTDAEGRASIPLVGLGTFRLDVSPSFLGDSLVLVDPSLPPFTVGADSTVQVQVGVSYPFVELEDVPGAVPGRRVFSSGIVLNPREGFGDGVVHIQLDTVALRMTRVDRVGTSPGDSVRVVGRTRIQEGRMTLDSVTLFPLVGSVVLVRPSPLNTADAASALGGRRDAWLVEVREATITAARARGPDWVVTADDGSGPVEVVVRDYLLFNLPLLVPGNTLERAAGLLRPVAGGGRWELYPRGAGDLTVRVRPADPPGG